MSYKFLGNVIIKGKIEVKTGMHIGGNKEKLEIGGVDNPVMRDPFSNYPFIPGSSLKGKMRMLLEFALGKVNEKGKPHSSDDPKDEICRIFGTSAQDSKSGPTRLTVRDAYPDMETQKMWTSLDTDLLFTEYKPENTIDRLTSEANPRFMERVVKGSKFNFEFVYSLYDFEDGGNLDLDNLKYIYQAMRMLESSGIGGSVSRGYGQIEFKFSEPTLVKNEDYKENSDIYKNISKSTDSLNCNYSLSDIENIEIKI